MGKISKNMGTYINMENIREDDGKSWDVGMKNFDENPSNSDRLVSDNQSK